MRRLWTTAAAAALCVFAADAWGAPYGGRLELVASHHHAKKAESTQKSSRHKGRAKSEESTSSSRHGRHSGHGLRGETSDETPAHARRGRHHAEAASDEGSHAKGRRGRHHAEEAAPQESRSRRGRHRTEEASDEAPVRGRHGRHARAPSEIRSEGGATVEVGRHDTLESLSKDTGVSVAELARLNHLRRPFHLRKGAELKMPERRYYVVKSGDTVYSLARKFGVESSELSSANDISRGHALRAGQKLYLPGGAHESAAPEEEEAQAPERTPPRPVRRPAPAPAFRPPSFVTTIPVPSQRPYATTPAPTYAVPTAPPSSPSVSSPPMASNPSQAPSQSQYARPPTPPAANQGFEIQQPRQPYQPPPSQSRPMVQSAPAPSAGDVATAGKGKFIWPVGGAVIQGFGPKADGQRNDGLNITSSAGDPVRAAADGEVVYAGDQVPSFGNLVLIKHPGGWVTAYAHMGRILVKNRDQVVQGQQIGAVGQTGQVDRPQLHFEIRYAPSPKEKAIPVDPALVLPAR